MNYKNQVVSLKLARRLEKAGYPQGEGMFTWVLNDNFEDWDLVFCSPLRKISPSFYPDTVEAPTVAELGEALPDRFVQEKYGDCFVIFSNGKDVTEKTEADARAKMWLWCKKNNYLPMED